MSITSEATTSMTLGQFIEEASLFTMSKEYFDLIKEASEIELLERYLDCQEYLQENSDLDDEITSELITESADNIEEIYESVKEKAGGLWEKIKKGFKNVINAIVTFFGRLVGFWKNGKELDKLRAEAKEIEKLSEENMEKTAAHIREILRGKQHAIDNFRGHMKEKDEKIKAKNKQIEDLQKMNADKNDQISKLQHDLDGAAVAIQIVSAAKDAEISRVHNIYKHKSDLINELREVENAIAEDIVVKMPENISEIDSYTAEVKKVVESYKVIRSKVAGNKDTHLKHARVIANLLDKLRQSRNRVVTKRINSAWLEEVYQSLLDSKEKIQAGMDDITATFNSANDTPDRIGTSKRKDIVGVRVSADKNYMELQRNLVGLLNEWMSLANGSIKTLKGLMDVRNHNMNIEAEILAEIRRYAG